MALLSCDAGPAPVGSRDTHWRVAIWCGCYCGVFYLEKNKITKTLANVKIKGDIVRHYSLK